MWGFFATLRHNTSRSASGAVSDRRLSGLPGETIHQTLSSPSRLSATSLIMRWATWGGLKDPPSRPMAWPGAAYGGWALRRPKLEEAEGRITGLVYRSVRTC